MGENTQERDVAAGKEGAGEEKATSHLSQPFHAKTAPSPKYHQGIKKGSSS
uniref:Uncharacterized protein n=1 Tax=Arundo donax TaxID=35708 RepID=A0A0A9GS88_ARUDO